MEVLLAIVVLIALIWCWDLYHNSHPLAPDEVRRLAKARQRAQALSKYVFVQSDQRVIASQKKAMRSEGQFVRCDLNYKTAPAWVAVMLKYKKHKWIVIGFVRSFRVRMLWWNKGPNRATVRPFLFGQKLDAAIEKLKPDAIAVLHNHPNPDPRVYSMSRASGQDLRSAAYLQNQIASKHNISLLEFVCERSVPYLFYAAFPDREVPIEPITQQIRILNGTTILANYRLRRELRRSDPNKRIEGSDPDAVVQRS